VFILTHCYVTGFVSRSYYSFVDWFVECLNDAVRNVIVVKCSEKIMYSDVKMLRRGSM
jgi:hypothetical protein